MVALSKSERCQETQISLPRRSSPCPRGKSRKRIQPLLRLGVWADLKAAKRGPKVFLPRNAKRLRKRPHVNGGTKRLSSPPLATFVFVFGIHGRHLHFRDGFRKIVTKFKLWAGIPVLVIRVHRLLMMVALSAGVIQHL